MPVNIYNAFLNASSYTLVYSADNINNFTINKSTGLIPFSLPIVSNTINTENRAITEQSELIHIGGVESTLNIDFEIGMPDVNNILRLVNNRISEQHKIEITEWSGQNSAFIFYGIIDSARVTQNGGDPRLSCNLTFMEGANTMAGLGY